ncbi:NAD(P)-dependent oxidoreductase [Nocardioides humi]|uniref:D-isomer specific 2-hydroxyacid dehydrogenase family protein n=1 Tax=Nocardioides humi TaxID=449461 RepID=A0ABN1ZQQ9_9ACTN|nr:NAD(P)-dependent oxidoreductase [Nocardioides humi]
MTGAAITAYGCEPDEAALFRRLAPRHGLTPTITAAAVSEATAALAKGRRCVSVGHRTPVTPPVLRALERAGVRYVSTRSVGYDHIDVDYAASLGITVGNVDYAPDGVADYTLMLILMVLRHARSTVRRADVHDYRLADGRGRELRDLTVGVVGTGRIGSAVITRLRGFGCRVLTHDHRPASGTEHTSLDDLLRRSDVVTLHTPLEAGTHHLLDRRRIARLKEGACVVNTGRGPLVDTAALLAALEAGRLGGAALDVLEGEQGVFYADCRDRVLDDALVRLQRLPNVLVTPHTAYYTDRALSDTVEHSLINCREFERQESAWIG